MGHQGRAHGTTDAGVLFVFAKVFDDVVEIAAEEPPKGDIDTYGAIPTDSSHFAGELK